MPATDHFFCIFAQRIDVTLVSNQPVVAGLSGTITRRAAESGEVVQAGQTVFTE